MSFLYIKPYKLMALQEKVNIYLFKKKKKPNFHLLKEDRQSQQFFFWDGMDPS